jgi:hypothetical protein
VLNQPLLVEWAVFNKKESPSFENPSTGVVSKYACGSDACILVNQAFQVCFDVRATAWYTWIGIHSSP